MTQLDTAPSGAPPEQRDVGPLFLANFVHQVVNPVNGVIGTLDNINDGTYKGPVVAQKINACRAQLEQCVTLIRNLAYLSEYFFENSSKETLKPVRDTGVSVLPQVIIESIQFFQIAADRKKMRIELTDPETKYVVLVRPELLRQVFMNLFDNWLKYGLDDQVVTVTPSVNKKCDLVVEISGASIGFLNTDAEDLFKLGFRSSSATAKVAQGSGIGLYVCRQIMEKNIGGSITAAHKKEGSISTFRISIPKKQWQH